MNSSVTGKIANLLDRLAPNWTNSDEIDRLAPIIASECMKLSGAAGFVSATLALLEISMREARARERLIGKPIPRLNLDWWIGVARLRLELVPPWNNSRWTGLNDAFADVVDAWIDATGAPK